MGEIIDNHNVTKEMREDTEKLQKGMEMYSIKNSDYPGDNELDILLDHIDALYLEGNREQIYAVRGRSEEILGYTIDEWHNYPGGAIMFWKDHIHPDHKYIAEQCFQLSSDGLDHEFVYRMNRKDGSFAWFHDKVKVEMDDNGEFLLRSFMIDITENKAVQIQLEEQDKLNEIGHIALGIAHDFNNILTGIMGYTSILEQQISDPGKTKFIDGILDGIDQAKQLSINLLSYGKNSEKMVQPVNLNKIILNINNILRFRLKNKTNLRVDLADNLKLIEADHSQMTQILLNLIVNAIEASDDGEEVLVQSSNVYLDSSFVNEFEHRYPGNYVRIDIIDTGPGISDEIQNKMYDPFFSTKPSGSGLGLTVVKNLLLSHEGIITYSTGDNGTIFTIYLPSLDQQVDLLEADTLQIIKGTGTIMCVDDNPMIRDVLDRILNQLGYDSIIFEKGQDAISYFKENYEDIDMVMLDFVMPEISGDELYSKLKDIDTGINAIIVTGYGQEFNVNKLMRMGVKEIVVKPFKLELLSETIHKILSS